MYLTNATAPATVIIAITGRINPTPAFGSESGDFVPFESLLLPVLKSFPPFESDVSTSIFIASLLFPAKSTIVIVSVVFFVYCFVNVFLSADNVQPVTTCICSLAVIVTVTTPFVSFVYFTVAVGFVLSVVVLPPLLLLLSLLLLLLFPLLLFPLFEPTFAFIVIGSLTFPFSSVIVIVPV